MRNGIRPVIRRCSILAFALLALAIAPIASSDAAYIHKYSSSFAVPGTPSAIDVEDQTGNVFVLNTAGEIHKYSATGAPVNFSALGTNVLSAPCGGLCRQIAVDNSGGTNQGVIYVGANIEMGGMRVFLPSGVEVGPFGNVAVGEGRLCGVSVDQAGKVYATQPSFEGQHVERYLPAEWATHPAQEPTITGTLKPLDFENPCRLAVDSTGQTYMIQGLNGLNTNPLRRYPSAAYGPPGAEKSGFTSTIVDPAATYVAVDLKTDDVYADKATEITRFNSSGALIEKFGGSPQMNNSVGVAVNDITKTVYVTNRETSDVSIYPKILPPDLTNLSATPSPGEAVLSGHVDLAGAGNAISCEFEYKLSTVPTFTSVPCDQPTPYESATDVTATVSGLVDGALYEYQLVSANNEASGTSAIHTFKIAPPSIVGVFSSDLSETTATLNARIDAHGSAATYTFEYGPSILYGNSAPVPAGEIAPGGQGSQLVSVPISGLQPQNQYHFRVVTTSSAGPTTSDDQSFNFRPPNCPNETARAQTGGSFLPDCRAYELVSPRNAGNVLLFSNKLAPPSSFATEPARFAFAGGAGGITGTEPINGLGIDTYLSTRTSTGWRTTYPGIKGYEGWGGGGAPGTMTDPGLDRFLQFNGVPNKNAPYLWGADGSFLGFWPATVTAIPDGNKINGYFQPSADFTHLAFSSSNVPFVPNGLQHAPGSAYDYDTVNGTTTLISRMPGGEDIPQEPGVAANWNPNQPEESIFFPGAPNTNVKHPAKVNGGISSDGTHILMQTAGEPYDREDPMPPGRLYMRVSDGGPLGITYLVSNGMDAEFVGMTADGAKVFFTSTEHVTADDHDTSTDLFMWSEATEEVTRVSAGVGAVGDTDSCSASWTAKCNIQPVVYNGRNSDTSVATQSGDAYFYSPEQLDGTRGTAGQQNLYVYRNGEVHFVAVANLSRINITPDGTRMAMIAKEQLTAYDNHGLAEMYTYNPVDGSIRCVSCIPTGAPPTTDVAGSLNGLFMAYDGRTFFYTGDSLVPKDSNGLFDVYEFVEGRPQLITTGTGAHDKTFSTTGVRTQAGLSGVSADGVNVYFASFESLVPEDENGQYVKFYDARANGGFPIDAPHQPCVAADECHGAASSPPSPTGIVSEGSLAGGNAAPTTRKGTHKVRKHKKAKRGRRHRTKRGRLHG